ncbi:hypothetical protein AB0K35_27600 [Micromonospora sp. NPDC053740]|uniref:hypothetical protein n=1 Tax=Micromonospora sp. NPDC053740 TaxID=3155173 RepID=UPI0034334268
MSNNPTSLIEQAAATLRRRGEAAEVVPGERYMVDSSADHGLVVGVYSPGDVNPDGSVSTGCAAYFAYPDGADGAAPAQSLAVAALMAGVDPVASKALADLLDESAGVWASLPNSVRGLLVRFAQSYLRTSEAR